jgi:hypothetical protein
MPLDQDFRITVVESMEGQRLDPRQATARAVPTPSREMALAVVRAAGGAEEVLQQVPNLGTTAAWVDIAFFSVCSKTGTALFLDLWDVDHFDFFTDLQSDLNNCRVWFTANGHEPYGAPGTLTGRVNCYFSTPADAFYLAIASLESDPPGTNATVRAVLDDFGAGGIDLGVSGFNGLVNLPFLFHLSESAHSIRIDQQEGGFFFYSMTIYQL